MRVPVRPAPAPARSIIKAMRSSSCRKGPAPRPPLRTGEAASLLRPDGSVQAAGLPPGRLHVNVPMNRDKMGPSTFARDALGGMNSRLAASSVRLIRHWISRTGETRLRVPRLRSEHIARLRRECVRVLSDRAMPGRQVPRAARQDEIRAIGRTTAVRNAVGPARWRKPPACCRCGGEIAS